MVREEELTLHNEGIVAREVGIKVRVSHWDGEHGA
jgi:hypothetical protein